MDFPKEILAGLACLKDKKFPVSSLQRVVDWCVLYLLEKESLENNRNIAPERKEAEQQLTATLLSLIVQVCKASVPAETIRESLLQDLGIIEQYTDIIVNAIIANQRSISDKLSAIQTLPPSLVDVNWRLDYVIKSNFHEKPQVFLIVLATIEEGHRKQIRFTCDQYQLQDLNSKLKEILRQAENFSNA